MAMSLSKGSLRSRSSGRDPGPHLDPRAGSPGGVQSVPTGATPHRLLSIEDLSGEKGWNFSGCPFGPPKTKPLKVYVSPQLQEKSIFHMDPVHYYKQGRLHFRMKFSN